MDLSELKTIQQNFIFELKHAQSGDSSSISWLVHKIPEVSLVKEGEVFQVVVIGGTVCRKGLVKKTDGTVEILENEKRDQPVFSSKEVLLEFIAKELLPHVEVLAINFAYPMDPVFGNGKLDGKLIAGSKEHEFKGLVGNTVGNEVEKYVSQKWGRKIRVSIANDTICLLLSGLTLHPAKNLACGIVGTGMNAALFLDNTTLINLETANFDKFPQSKEGKTIDQESALKGNALFEKETTGAYLYQHFNMILKKKKIDHSFVESTYEVKKIALDKNDPLSSLARELIEKSAAYIACMISAITEFKARDMIFVMDGSFFWEADIYKNFVEEYVKKLTHFSVSFVQIEDTTLYGAAKLVC